MRASTFLCALALGCSGQGSSDPSVDPVPLFRDGEAVAAEVPPPPLTGGTLLATRDRFAVVSNPDDDLVHFVSLDTLDVTTVALEAGDEPGRAVEDEYGRVHVILRRAGAVVSFQGGVASFDSITPSTGWTRVDRRDVCD